MTESLFIYSTFTQRIVSTSPTFTVRTVADLKVTAHFAPISRIIVLDGSYLAWNQQMVGEPSVKTFTIRNIGNRPLNVTDIAYPDGFSGNWTGQIAPGGSQSVQVAFTPPSAGTFTGDIVVHSDATSGTSFVGVHATGENAYLLTGFSAFSWYPGFSEKTSSLQLTYWKGSIVNVLACPVSGYVFKSWTEKGKVVSNLPGFDLTMDYPHNLKANYDIALPIVTVGGRTNFGSRKIRKISRQHLYLSNTGNAAVYISGLRIANRGGGTQRIFECNWSGWLQPGQHQRIAITFKPNRKIKYSCRIFPLMIDSNASWEELRVSGSGI